MATEVTVAVHIDRAEAIRAGRNVWGWVPTTLDLDKLDEAEREALSLCPEHEGVLRLTHATSAGRLYELFESPESYPRITEANPEAAQAVLRALIEYRKALLAKAHGEASAIAAAADELCSQMERWLTTPPADCIAESQSEQFSDRRFFVSVRPPELRLSWRPDVIGEWGFGTRDRPGLTEAAAIVQTARTEAETRLSSFLEDHPAAIAEHSEAIREELAQRRSAFEFQRDEAKRLRVPQNNLLAEARKRSAVAEDRDRLAHWAEQYGHQAILTAMAQENVEDLASALREEAFRPLRHLPRHRKITKTDLLAANPSLTTLATGLQAEFDTADDEFTDERQRSTATTALRSLLESGIAAQILVRVHRGQLTRHGTNVGVPVFVRSFLLTVAFGDITVSREFALPEPEKMIRQDCA